ncbi:MAG: nucleoside transporter C-terminal domain-containing protein [Pseudomonadota bacterium]
MEWGWDNARALIGMAVIFAIAWGLSENRRAFPWRIVLGAVGIQFGFALLLFAVPPVREALFSANIIVDALEDATRAGTSFVFGYVGDNSAASAIMDGDAPPLFFFQILPIVIVVAALSAMLWHWRILRWITKGFAVVFRRGMGIGGATSLAVSANVFMGMTEAPVLVKPYLKGMTRSELFILMTTGFATIAGSVLIIYVTFLEGVMSNPLAQLLTASIIAAPAAVALALTMVPETAAKAERAHEPDFEYESTMDAFATGAADGLKIVLNIATMLIAALALLFIVNALLQWLGDVSAFSPWAEAQWIKLPSWLGILELILQSVWAGFLWLFKILLLPFYFLNNWAGEQGLTIQVILGWVFSPLMYLIGVPWEEAARSGSLMGIKTVLTEFVAFLELAQIPADEMSPRTRIITAHAICGFANFGSMGILIGGLTIIEPGRRDTFLQLAWKTLIAGTLATCLSGAVVGALPVDLFVRG